MMKAVVIHKYGSVDEMNVMNIPKPKVGDYDVLIEVHAAAVNPVDIAIRNGWLQDRYSYHFPLVLGWDVSGIVREIGKMVTKFKVGDEVYSSPALARNGTYAEFVAVEEQLVALKPNNISFQVAASIPLVGITAYRALIEIGKLKEGQRVLILGGSGGVGSFAVQLAKSVGASVIATTSGKNIEFVKSLGADTVIDYTITDNFEDEFDVIFDTVGGKSVKQSLYHVKPGGKLISITTFFSKEDIKYAKEKGFSIELFFSEPSGDILTYITSFVEQEKIKPVVSSVYTLDEVQKAHELSESRHARGKIILQVK